MAVRDEQLVDEVFVLDGGRTLAATASTLGLVVRHGLGFCVAGMRQSDHQILPLDQVLDGHVRLIGDDLGTTLVTISGFHRREFFANDFQQPLRAREDVAQITDLVQQFAEFDDDLVLLETRQAMQAKIEDGLGLLLRQPVLAVMQPKLIRNSVRARRHRACARKHLRHRTGAPRARLQRCFRFRR